MSKFSRKEIVLLRRRQRGYVLLLIFEILLLVLLPMCEEFPPLTSAILTMLAIGLMRFLILFSSLKRVKVLIWVLGVAAMVMEWTLNFFNIVNSLLGSIITPLHLAVWLSFLSYALYRIVLMLMREPYVTYGVILGAAAGYLLIGFAGGVLLNAIWVFHPETFNLIQPDQSTNALAAFHAVAPKLFTASFGVLTTVGSSLPKSESVIAQISSVSITITGQLYVAILISMILGRFHRFNT
ncbi:MAG: hypothetical protein CL862_02605 [Cyanobium sp. NAT70]|nr:hypothetical protein [Cyanobium sp. NAT70]|tara:strand:+ start:2321 stop:3037 length:717 start_codon:yes stop_codon:yes gene_type:complete